MYKEPTQKINEHYIRIDMLIKNLQNSVISKYKDRKNEMVNLVSKLDSLSPLKTLTRGYCIARAKKRKSNKIGRRIKYR